MVTLLFLALAASSLEQLATKLQGAPAWQARFSQVFLPAGLTHGSEEHGLFTFSYPSHVRFDYHTQPQRIFAVDGVWGRMVDVEAGTCQAVALNEGSWTSLPLLALADPGALRALFTVEEHKDRITLLPRQPSPQLARVFVLLGSEGLPQQIVVEDVTGNRNDFRFSRWQVQKSVAKDFFSPSLPGQPPCVPGGDNPRPQR